MDAAGLRSRIQATLDANADVRRQAELDLKAVRDILRCTVKWSVVEWELGLTQVCCE